MPQKKRSNTKKKTTNNNNRRKYNYKNENKYLSWNNLCSH